MKKYKDYKEFLIAAFDGYKLRFLLSSLIVIFRGVILLLPSVVTQHIIDDVLPGGSISLVMGYALLLVAIPLTVSALIIVDLFIDRYILTAMSRTRCEIYDGIQHQPLKWFRETSAADLMNRMLNETEDIMNFGYFGVGSVIWFNVTIIVGLSLMLTRNWKAALLLLALILCQAYITDLLGKKHKKNAKQLAESEAAFSDRVMETVTGIQFVKAAVGEEAEIRKAERILDEQYRLQMQRRRIELCTSVVKAFFIGIANIILYYIGGILVLRGELTIGGLVALSSLYTWVQPAIFGYQSMYVNAKRIIPSLERVCDFLFRVDEKEGSREPAAPVSLQVQDIGFSYDGMRDVIKDISFTADAGETVAVIGASGSGKSTLAGVLLGLWPQTSGRVSISGVDNREISDTWFRQNVLYVSQDTRLRSVSIAENIRYQEKNISERRLWEALRVACLDQWVSSLPDGLNTFIGENAAMISGGERQRICIARAVLRRPRILILDEATSALDTETEQKLIANLKAYLQDSILLFVTHRTGLLSYSNIVVKIGNI